MGLNVILCDYQGNFKKKITDDFFIIDGSNVAYQDRNYQKKPQLKNLTIIKQKLETLGIKNYHIICDRSLNYTIDDKENYKKLVKKSIIIETPEGTKADIFILQITQEKNGYNISNDIFKSYYKLYEPDWIKHRRISFKIIDDNIFFDKLILKDV